ncbi:MAG: tetratricopeptide repeat protein, partial [Hyphomicrobium sp.]
ALAYTNRGVAYGTKGAFDRAIADYTKAIALDPKYGLAYTIRALAYESNGEVERAIADFSKVLEIDSSDENAKNNLKRLGIAP